MRGGARPFASSRRWQWLHSFACRGGQPVAGRCRDTEETRPEDASGGRACSDLSGRSRILCPAMAEGPGKPKVYPPA